MPVVVAAVLIPHKVDLLAPAVQAVVVLVRMELQQPVLREPLDSVEAVAVEQEQVVRAATAALASSFSNT
jgi:hypothetical protein